MQDARQRVIIERVRPQVDCGRFEARRAVGERVRVEADIFADGHDVIAAELLHRPPGAQEWIALPLEHRGNDRWAGSFQVDRPGVFAYTVRAWIDRFLTWRSRIEKKAEAGQDVSAEMLAGERLVAAAALRAPGEAGARLRRAAEALARAAKSTAAAAREAALDPELAALMARHAERPHATLYDRELRVRAERERARFGAWYELFPRSCTSDAGRHGTLRDCIDRLGYVAEMGFDVLYLPPIHPIGRTHRKGPDNSPQAGPGDPGSPWAIGSEQGGHTAVHSELGTMEDLHALIEAARGHGIEIALDMAFQCSPDHPYVREHPEWFRAGPDGTIRYAENPPKRYEDIYPFDFEGEAVESLQNELLEIFRFWIAQGVRIFRVDNPHTKSLRFWDWVIGVLKEEHPDVILLSEAFTRPRVMQRLAKGGFTQSYTYFTWRNTKRELEEYFTELNDTGVRDFFWPNLWPNTPDILPEYLQYGGRAAFVVRLVLAATLSSSYGIYGPAFELCVGEPRAAFAEEYKGSEKYQIVPWDLNQPQSLKPLIARVNQIRRGNPALQRNENLAFHPVDRDEIICYSKHTDDLSNIIVVVANLDPHHTQSAWVRVPLERFGLAAERSYQMHDLVTGARYLWHSDHNYVELDPGVMPAHVFRLRLRARTEHDFDYFM